VFADWLDRLADKRAVERIAQRLVRLEAGLLGDVRSLGEGLSELRIDHGAGYRVYFVRRGMMLIVLLCGGDKRGQSKDIARARVMARDLEV
jgi:putative addiction module killer protein